MPEEPKKDGRIGQQARHGRDENVISVPEAAKELVISKDLAYSLARRGELPGAIQLGRRWVVSRIKLRRAIHGPEDGVFQEPG
jgi:predicted DNA-binding transcriptional regulator AlpA